MAAPPFKVKSIYSYSSEHDDDLKFPEGQIITVTEEEDADWYVGEYIDSGGETQAGLFPKNFVERYEPAPPPRPVRAARPKPAEPPAPEAPKEAPSPPIPAVSKPKVEEPEPVKPAAAPPAPSAPPEEPAAPAASPKRARKAPEVNNEPPVAPKPAQATPAKGPPPPVAGKSSSFKDRLAAFNKAGAAPIAPFKPGGSSATTFIKKPFVAPPPSRNAYIPQPREPPPQKLYRRDEDPEIAQRKAEDDEAAEKAGLAPGTETETPNADAPKPVSLKERIALLQKQQMEQAARRAESSQKKKPERPPKKRIEPQEVEEAPARDSIDTDGGERPVRESLDIPRENVRRSSRGPKVPESAPRETFSDGNDADQSAAGETTEDANGDSTTEDESTVLRHPKAPAAEPDVGDEEDATEEEEEMDEETRHQLALRERMAKLSGGMGMAGMFGPPGGIAMPGVAGGLPKKKKPAPLERRATEEVEPSPTSPAPRVPMIPIPGIGRTLSHDSGLKVEREDEGHPISGERGPDEVPDIEDVKQAPVRAEGAERTVPLPPTQERTASLSPTITERGAPPPIPGGRPSTEGRPAPPPPPAQVESPTAGSESDDEMPESADIPIRGAPPPVPGRGGPQSPSSPSVRRSLDREPTSPSSPSSIRMPPPIPISSPTMAPSAQARPPPPPPPTQAPPTRHSTIDPLHKRALGASGEDGSEYEGDYDTDIASGAKHKDALKAHGRESSLDDSTAAEDTPFRSPSLPSTVYVPPIPTSVPRGVPPIPPSGPPGRRSGDTPRGLPPPIPSNSQYDDGDDGEEDYDPYNYSSGLAIPAQRAPPPPTPTQAPRPPSRPAMPPPPPVPASHEEESVGEEDELYASPPPRKSVEQSRKSVDRPPPPLPPQAPPRHDRGPPPLPQSPPLHYNASPLAPPSGKAPMRPSMDNDRPFPLPSRVSTEPTPRVSTSSHRPDVGDTGFIARDMNLTRGPQWWAQPNLPPSSVQGRNDVLYEIEETSSPRRGGKTTVSKDVYILFQDYSQTFVTARYDASNPDDVQLEQRHEPPPGKPRQDQLEQFWSRFGSPLARSVEKHVNGPAVGDASSHSLIIELLRGMRGALPPVGTRAYGALVYANMGNATVQQFDEIRPGDIVSFRNARFSGKHGNLHTKYSLDVASHVGICIEWDGTKRKLRVAEQGRDSHGEVGEAADGKKLSKEKEKKRKGKVEVESYRLGDLRSGEVRVWRIVGRSFVGWEDASG